MWKQEMIDFAAEQFRQNGVQFQQPNSTTIETINYIISSRMVVEVKRKKTGVVIDFTRIMMSDFKLHIEALIKSGLI